MTPRGSLHHPFGFPLNYNGNGEKIVYWTNTLPAVCLPSQVTWTGFLHMLTNGFFSMTFHQISMTKLKSRYKHEQFRKCWASRAYAGLHFERLSFKFFWFYFKLGINEHVIITNFHDFSKTFMISSFFHDFSRPGNDHFKIPWLFQVFHDRTNPAWSYSSDKINRKHAKWFAMGPPTSSPGTKT